MANEFITLSKTAGTGIDTVTVEGFRHTGRKSRSCRIIVKNKTGEKPSKTITLTEEAAALSVISDTASLSAVAAAGNLDFQFRTNAKTFRIDLSALAGIGVTISSVKINDVAITATSGIYTITGDTGASAEVETAVTIAVAENTGPAAKSGAISVVGSGDSGQADVTVSLPITQSAGESTLSVSPTTLTIPATGGSKTFTITSNDEWTIEIE